MPSSHEIIRCRYNYDPLDRLVSVSPSADAASQLFYCKTRLATEIHGLLKRSIFQHDDQLLAQRSAGARAETTMLVTDWQRSVLHTVNTDPTRPIAYSPYGHRPASSDLLSLLGFNGERREPVTGHYFLGSGYRAFNPVLMRFNSPDSWSPFGDGGLNSYAYCLGDPVNRRDPSGHAALLGAFVRFAEAFNARGNVVSRLAGSSSLGRLSNSSIVALPALDPIRMPSFIYHPMGRSLGSQSRSRLTGSLDSIDSFNSNRSTESIPSLLSDQSFGSNSSIVSAGSTSSTATASSGSGRVSISSDSDWSGSGRRRGAGWHSNESLDSVASYSSESTPRLTFEDTMLSLDDQGHISYRSNPMPTHVARIRRQSGQ